MGTMALSLALPAVAWMAPATLPADGLLIEAVSSPVVVPPPGAPTLLEAAPHVQHPVKRVVSAVDGWLPVLWGLSSAAAIALLVGTLSRLRRLRAECVPAVLDDMPVLLSDCVGPAVLGVLRPVVIVPRRLLDVPDEERRLIVRHEREHVSAGDSRLLLLSALALAAMPWNPALWWQHRHLRLAVETDCDARVLATGSDRRIYGRALLRTAAGGSPLPFLSPAWGEPVTLLEKRILAMTAKTPRHRVLRALPALGLTALAVAAACDAASNGNPVTAPAPDAIAPSESPSATVATAVENPDGTMLITVPDLDPTGGSLGLSYGWNKPFRLREGQPLRMPYYPVVTSLVAGSSAKEAGLMVGDTILSANGRDAREPKLFPDRRPGTWYTVRIRRGVAEREVGFQVDRPIDRHREHEAVFSDSEDGKTIRMQAIPEQGDFRAGMVRFPLELNGRITVESPFENIAVEPVDADHTPLILVDGVRVESLSEIDPERIKMVEVIKGPAAVERYGPEVADGVILVTTKKP